MNQIISSDNKLAEILDIDICKKLISEAINKNDSCVILCPHYSINIASKYDDCEALQYDLDELEEYLEETLEVTDYDDLIVDLTYLQEKYVVNVGNIGNIECDSESEAFETFDEYVSQSKSEGLRASGESVYLTKGEETIKEYIGTIDSEEDGF